MRIIKPAEDVWDASSVYDKTRQQTQDTINAALAQQIETKYEEPAGGIPSTDLAADVQIALEKAGTALQEVPNTYRTAATQDEIDEAQDAEIADVKSAFGELENICIKKETVSTVYVSGGLGSNYSTTNDNTRIRTKGTDMSLLHTGDSFEISGDFEGRIYASNALGYGSNVISEMTNGWSSGEFSVPSTYDGKYFGLLLRSKSNPSADISNLVDSVPQYVKIYHVFQVDELVAETNDKIDSLSSSTIKITKTGETVVFENTADAPICNLVSEFPYRAEGYTGFRLFGYDYNFFGIARKNNVGLNGSGEETSSNGYTMVGPIYVPSGAQTVNIWWEDTYTSGGRVKRLFAYDENDQPTKLAEGNYTAANQSIDGQIPNGTKYIKLLLSTQSRNIRIAFDRIFLYLNLQNPFYGGIIDWLNGYAKNLYASDGTAVEETETFEPFTAHSFANRTEIFTAINGANYLPQGMTTATVMLSNSSISEQLQKAEKTGLEGLHLSLLGASIESFNNWTPPENDVYYSSGTYGVYNVDQMWWKRLCNATGMIPLVIDAWSGSSVCYNYGTDSSHSDTRRIPMCSDLRTGRLASNDIAPDVIIVVGGTNDWTYSQQTTTPLGSWDGRTAIDRAAVLAGQSTFKESYASMIAKLQENYPEAVIVCTSLEYTWRGINLGITRVNEMGFSEADYSKAIEDVCKIMGVPYIDIYNVGFNSHNYYPTYCIDNETYATHPNAEGHEVIAKRFIEELPRLVKQFK